MIKLTFKLLITILAKNIIFGEISKRI